jgi:catechol 2,3-dioxygenase-like lactoylglutathione lyase family enzyme
MPSFKGTTMQALKHIRQIDYTVIFARNMEAMRHFYETVMEFPLLRTLSDRWIEYRVGSTTLALTAHGRRFNDPPPAPGALSLQLAFRVAPQTVADCAAALEAKGVKLISPLTDQPFGHRTIFFRDPDGNVLEIFAEI